MTRKKNSKITEENSPSWNNSNTRFGQTSRQGEILINIRAKRKVKRNPLRTHTFFCARVFAYVLIKWGSHRFSRGQGNRTCFLSALVLLSEGGHKQTKTTNAQNTQKTRRLVSPLAGAIIRCAFSASRGVFHVDVARASSPYSHSVVPGGFAVMSYKTRERNEAPCRNDSTMS